MKTKNKIQQKRTPVEGEKPLHLQGGIKKWKQKQ